MDTQVKDMIEEFGDLSKIFVQKEKRFGFVRIVS